MECMGPLVLGVESSPPVLTLASDSPLLGVGEGSRFEAPFDFLEARGLEVVLRDECMDEGDRLFTTPTGISPSDFRLFAVVDEISVESSLRVLFGLDFELEM